MPSSTKNRFASSALRPYALRGASGAMGARATSAVSSESGSSDAAMIASSMALTVPATEIAEAESYYLPRSR
jgi:hypothetical protein